MWAAKFVDIFQSYNCPTNLLRPVCHHIAYMTSYWSHLHTTMLVDIFSMISPRVVDSLFLFMIGRFMAVQVFEGLQLIQHTITNTLT